MVRIPRKTASLVYHKLDGIQERPEMLESPLTVLAWRVISEIKFGLYCKLRTLDKAFGYLVIASYYGIRFAEVSFRNYL